MMLEKTPKLPSVKHVISLFQEEENPRRQELSTRRAGNDDSNEGSFKREQTIFK